jgi:hypothetical protein
MKRRLEKRAISPEESFRVEPIKKGVLKLRTTSIYTSTALMIWINRFTTW